VKNYIRGIDGLRAIAVMAVIVFHASPTSLRGGFIGVDIFFVISGFIITTTYFAALRDNRISLRHFFMKRVRRLAPIYLVVLVVTTIASYAILTPIHLKHFAESLIAQPFYLQNIVFWHHGDYFEQALSKPLLHTWSLAVEEQFYLTYAILILVVRRAPKLTIPLLLTATVGSLALGYALSTVSPKTAFYWLPPRMWQMAIGVLAALLTARLTTASSRASWRHALYPALALVIWAIVGFDERARFPGMQSIAACVGTAVALVSVTSTEAGPMLRVLTNPLVVHVGKLSYSLYLWHWPIIALASTYAERSLRPAEALVAIIATFAVSQLGYGYIERPVRTGTALPQDRQLLGLAACGGVLTVAVAFLFVATDGATFRYPPQIAKLYVAQQQRSPFRCPSLGRLVDPHAEVCKINAVTSDRNILVLGDSHADVLDEMIARVAADQGMGAFLTKRDCKLYDFGERPECSTAVLREIQKEIETNKIEYVLAMAFTKKDFTEEKQLQASVLKLLETVDGVYLMQVVPNGPYFDPGERARALRNNQLPPPQYTLADYLADNHAAIESMRRVAAADARIKVLDPSSYLCPQPACDFDTNGAPNYFDAHHNSPTGAKRLEPMFAEVLRNLPHNAFPRSPSDGGARLPSFEP
jgi:peptidoglycan/LPS O-acetylase OafA/YrhL